MNKITVTFDGSRIRFSYPHESYVFWSCYPVEGLDLETFLEKLKPLMIKHGWITPYDAQEQACRNGLATYA